MNLTQNFKALAEKLALEYKGKPDLMRKDLEMSSIRGSLYETYKAMVKGGELVPIERLDVEQKTRYWNESKGITDDQDSRIIISRCIYLLQFLSK